VWASDVHRRKLKRADARGGNKRRKIMSDIGGTKGMQSRTKLLVATIKRLRAFTDRYELQREGNLPRSQDDQEELQSILADLERLRTLMAHL
jgi:hypothetical protein